MKVRVRLLPLTIFAAVLMLSVRVGDVWRQVDIGIGEESAAQVTPTGTKAAVGDKGGQWTTVVAGAVLLPPVELAGLLGVLAPVTKKRRR